MSRMRRIIDSTISELADKIIEGENIPPNRYFTDDSLSDPYYTDDNTKNIYLWEDE